MVLRQNQRYRNLDEEMLLLDPCAAVRSDRPPVTRSEGASEDRRSLRCLPQVCCLLDHRRPRRLRPQGLADLSPRPADYRRGHGGSRVRLRILRRECSHHRPSGVASRVSRRLRAVRVSQARPNTATLIARTSGSSFTTRPPETGSPKINTGRIETQTAIRGVGHIVLETLGKQRLLPAIHTLNEAAHIHLG